MSDPATKNITGREATKYEIQAAPYVCQATTLMIAIARSASRKESRSRVAGLDVGRSVGMAGSNRGFMVTLVGSA
jgi:hypothetical protein